MLQDRLGKKYSLWLMPRGDVYEQLARVLHNLAAQCGAPEFPPHLTLLGSIVGARREVIRKSAEIAALLHPFSIRLGAIDYLDPYFRCLFVRATPTAPLLKAHHTARTLLGRHREPCFMPHLSLLYGNFSLDFKQGLLARLGPRLDLEFKVRSLNLYSTDSEPRLWRRVETFGLK